MKVDLIPNSSVEQKSKVVVFVAAADGCAYPGFLASGYGLHVNTLDTAHAVSTAKPNIAVLGVVCNEVEGDGSLI